MFVQWVNINKLCRSTSCWDLQEKACPFSVSRIWVVPHFLHPTIPSKAHISQALTLEDPELDVCGIIVYNYKRKKSKCLLIEKGWCIYFSGVIWHLKRDGSIYWHFKEHYYMLINQWSKMQKHTTIHKMT